MRKILATKLVCCLGLGAAWWSASLSVATAAADWPQFLGPHRNGTYTGPPLPGKWPAEGPPVVWKRAVGAGFAGPAVSGDRVILHHRTRDEAVVECLELKTGQVLWKGGHPTDYQDDFGFDEGPRATPSIGVGRVITFGAEGHLQCWNLTNGAALWKVDTAKDFGSGKGFFGRAASPLICSDLVIVTIGGRGGAGVVAFDLSNGKVRWKATEDEAGYAAPTFATIRGTGYILALTRSALVTLRPADGGLIFRYLWRPPMQASVTAATPLVMDDLIFLSASYGTGASLLRFRESGPELIWSEPDRMSNHYATCVEHDGLLFGWHGRQEQGCEFRCVELKTGKLRWTQEGLKAGTVTLVGSELLLLTERGELIRLPATADGFKPSARVQILPAEVRAAPALADGCFVARGQKSVVCLDLAPKP